MPRPLHGLIHCHRRVMFVEELHKKYQWLIFDFDGTIGYLEVDWNGFNQRLQEIARDEFGHEVPISHSSLYQNTLVDVCGQAIVPKIIETGEQFELAQLGKTTFNASVVEFIIQHSTGFNFALYTSNTRLAVEQVLREHALLDFFTATVTRNDVVFLKPNPEGMYKLIAAHDLQKNALFIGDSNFDGDAAQAAGVDFMFVDKFVEQI